MNKCEKCGKKLTDKERIAQLEKEVETLKARSYYYPWISTCLPTPWTYTSDYGTTIITIDGANTTLSTATTEGLLNG